MNNVLLLSCFTNKLFFSRIFGRYFCWCHLNINKALSYKAMNKIATLNYS